MAKNSILSFVQMLVPLVVAIVTMPYLIHRLGVERFGILTLLTVLQGGYASLFDLGMGRATTYFVANSLGRGDYARVPRVAFTSLCVQAAAGVVAGGVLALLTPMLTGKFLHISPSLQSEARITFWWVSASFPLLAIFRNLRAILEAHQRFDVVTLIQVPSSSVIILLPAVGAWDGFHLPGIFVLLTVWRLITTGTYLIVCKKIVPNLWSRIGFEKELLRSLFSYGGWITLCDSLRPILNYSDRFIIGAIVSVQTVAYYTAPFEAVSKTLIIPSAIVAALFPALGTLHAADEKRVAKLYAHGLKSILLLMTPVILLVVLFANNILTIWIGRDFAERSQLVLQLLAVGILLNGVSNVATTWLDGLGRPDLRAKVLLVLVLPTLLLLVTLTKLFGVNGTAAGWLIATGTRALVYLWLPSRVLPQAVTGLRESTVRAASFLSITSMFAAGGIVLAFADTLMFKSLASALLLAFFLAGAWKFVLDGPVKNYMLAALRWG